MKTFLRYISTAIFSVGLLASSGASAALIEFTTRAAFDAATTAQIVEPFTAPEGSYIALFSQTYNGINYPPFAYMIDPGYAPDLYQFGSGAILLLSNDTSLSFAPVSAFAADFAALGGDGSDITITIGGIEVVLATSPQELTFHGFISTTPFTSISLASAAELIVLDNVTRASAATGIPEPRSFALFALALAGLALARRRP